MHASVRECKADKAESLNSSIPPASQHGFSTMCACRHLDNEMVDISLLIHSDLSLWYHSSVPLASGAFYSNFLVSTRPVVHRIALSRLMVLSFLESTLESRGCAFFVSILVRSFLIETYRYLPKQDVPSHHCYTSFIEITMHIKNLDLYLNICTQTRVSPIKQSQDLLA